MSPKRPAREERPGEMTTCDPRKLGECASHCAVALLLAVMDQGPVAGRQGCCLLANGSVALVH